MLTVFFLLIFYTIYSWFSGTLHVKKKKKRIQEGKRREVGENRTKGREGETERKRKRERERDKAEEDRTEFMCGV